MKPLCDQFYEQFSYVTLVQRDLSAREQVPKLFLGVISAFSFEFEFFLCGSYSACGFDFFFLEYFPECFFAVVASVEAYG
jgi:hypothetical protein